MTRPVFMHIHYRGTFGALLIILQGILINSESRFPNPSQSWGNKKGRAVDTRVISQCPFCLVPSVKKPFCLCGTECHLQEYSLISMAMSKYPHLPFTLIAASYLNFNKHFKFLGDWFRSLSSECKA